MSISLVVAVLVGTAAVVVGSIVKGRRARQLPDHADQDFLAKYHQLYRGDAKDVLAARGEIASVFGIPAGKLMPDQSIDALSSRLDTLGDFSVGYNDLLHEIEERRHGLGEPPPRSAPKTVGEMVEQLISPAVE